MPPVLGAPGRQLPVGDHLCMKSLAVQDVLQATGDRCATSSGLTSAERKTSRERWRGRVGDAGAGVGADHVPTGADAVLGDRELRARRWPRRRGKEIAGVGIGSPGRSIRRPASCLAPPPHLGGRIPAADRLAAAWICPPRSTTMLTAPFSANGAGRARSDPRWSGSTIGTGIGGGIVLAGQIYRGASDVAGEIGHMSSFPRRRSDQCGNDGSPGPTRRPRRAAASRESQTRLEPRTCGRSRPRRPRPAIDLSREHDPATDGRPIVSPTTWSEPRAAPRHHSRKWRS